MKVDPVLPRFLEALARLPGFQVDVKDEPLPVGDGLSQMITIKYKNHGIEIGAPYTCGDTVNTWNVVGAVSQLILVEEPPNRKD